MKKLWIWTLSWNGVDKLKQLRSGLNANLAKLTYNNGQLKPEWEFPEWFVRDNGSKDGTVGELNCWKFLSDSPFAPTVFEIKHNRDNFAQGMNDLASKSNLNDDDLILLLNNDIVFNDNTSLLNMWNLIQRPEVGAVGARLLYTNTNKLQHAGTIFGPQYGNMPFHYKHQKESDKDAERNRYFQSVTAACCLIKAKEFKKVGGLCEGYSWAFDDVDLCLRINQNSKVAYCGQTNISHEESASLKKNPVNKLFLKQNVDLFKKTWWGKYDIDHQKYLDDPNYNAI